jgi:hypothetical protein
MGIAILRVPLFTRFQRVPGLPTRLVRDLRTLAVAVTLVLAAAAPLPALSSALRPIESRPAIAFGGRRRDTSRFGLADASPFFGDRTPRSFKSTSAAPTFVVYQVHHAHRDEPPHLRIRAVLLQHRSARSWWSGRLQFTCGAAGIDRSGSQCANSSSIRRARRSSVAREFRGALLRSGRGDLFGSGAVTTRRCRRS